MSKFGSNITHPGFCMQTSAWEMPASQPETARLMSVFSVTRGCPNKHLQARLGRPAAALPEGNEDVNPLEPCCVAPHGPRAVGLDVNMGAHAESFNLPPKPLLGGRLPNCVTTAASPWVGAVPQPSRPNRAAAIAQHSDPSSSAKFAVESGPQGAIYSKGRAEVGRPRELKVTLTP